MAINNFLEKIFIIILLKDLVNSLSCDGIEIENCLKCGSGKNSSRCEICEDKYFLALDGEYCINCDHEYWGMAGCAGRCEMIKSIKNVNCTDNICKEGYYLIYPGFCAKCSFLFDHCQTCTYLPISQSNQNKTFKCLQCDEGYYFSNGKCKKCNSPCRKCRNNGTCYIDECDEGYYFSADEGKCKRCFDKCKKCKNNLTCDECFEEYYYNPSKTRCFTCSLELTGCIKCKNDYKKVICTETSKNYYISENNTIIQCLRSINGCAKCLKNNSELICIGCAKDYYFSSDGKQCKPCRKKENNEGCIICSDDDKCKRCDEGYYYISEKSCGKCSDLFGEGCSSCSISPYDFKPYCTKCLDDYFYDYDGKCKKININIIGCKYSEGLLGRKGYSCKLCDNDFILVDNIYCIPKNNSKAIPNCLEMEEIIIDENEEKIYSCLKCENNYILAINFNGAKSCVSPLEYKELDLCRLSRKENIGENNYTCLTCEKGILL